MTLDKDKNVTTTTFINYGDWNSYPNYSQLVNVQEQPQPVYVPYIPPVETQKKELQVVEEKKPIEEKSKDVLYQDYLDSLYSDIVNIESD